MKLFSLLLVVLAALTVLSGVAAAPEPDPSPVTVDNIKNGAKAVKKVYDVSKTAQKVYKEMKGENSGSGPVDSMKNNVKAAKKAYNIAKTAHKVYKGVNGG